MTSTGNINRAPGSDKLHALRQTHAHTLPTTMLYDRQGILRQKDIGFEYTDTIEAYLNPLL